jgi:hypothetical protein
MAYLLVLVLAAAAGAAVYVVTLRHGPVPSDPADGREPSDAGSPEPGFGGSYVPVVASNTDWESRVTSALGLVIAVIMGAVALAASTYLAFSVAGRLLHRFTG